MVHCEKQRDNGGFGSQFSGIEFEGEGGVGGRGCAAVVRMRGYSHRGKRETHVIGFWFSVLGVQIFFWWGGGGVGVVGWGSVWWRES